MESILLSLLVLQFSGPVFAGDIRDALKSRCIAKYHAGSEIFMFNINGKFKCVHNESGRPMSDEQARAIAFRSYYVNERREGVPRRYLSEQVEREAKLVEAPFRSQDWLDFDGKEYFYGMYGIPSTVGSLHREAKKSRAEFLAELTKEPNGRELSVIDINKVLLHFLNGLKGVEDKNPTISVQTGKGELEESPTSKDPSVSLGKSSGIAK